jgi:hypothetical protein
VIDPALDGRLSDCGEAKVVRPGVTPETINASATPTPTRSAITPLARSMTTRLVKA